MTAEDDLATKAAAIIDGTVLEGRSQVAAVVASVIDAGGTSEAALVDMVRDPARPLALRIDVCWMIPRLALPAAADILASLLSDPEDKLREEAAAGLGLVQQDGSIEVLRKVVQDDAAKPVRLAALHALGLFSSPQAAAALREVLANLGEPDDVRADAAEALAHHRDEGIVDLLIGCLGDTSPLVRYSAAYALGEQGDAKALSQLTELASHDFAATPWGTVASSAQRAIEAIGERDADPDPSASDDP